MWRGISESTCNASLQPLIGWVGGSRLGWPRKGHVACSRSFRTELRCKKQNWVLNAWSVARSSRKRHATPPWKQRYHGGLSKSHSALSIVSKQELYFVKENYEIFSTEVSAREKQGQNSGEPYQGVIGSLGISSAVRPFWIWLPVGEYLSLNVPCRSLCIVQFLFLPSYCDVSLRKQF